MRVWPVPAALFAALSMTLLSGVAAGVLAVPSRTERNPTSQRCPRCQRWW